MPRRLLRKFASDEIRDLRRAMHDYCLENNLFTLTDSFNEKMFNINESPAPDADPTAASVEDDRFASALAAPAVDIEPPSTPMALSAQWWNDCELERQSNIERKVSKSGATATGVKFFQQQHSKKSSLRSESLKDHDSRMSDCDEPPSQPHYKDEVVHLPSHLREKAANLLRQRKTSKNTRTGQQTTKPSALSAFYVQGDFVSDSSRSGSGRSSADGSVSLYKRKESADNAAHYAQWIDEHQCHEDMVSLDQIYRQQWNDEHGIAGGDLEVMNGTQKLTIDSPETTGRFWFPTEQVCAEDPQTCATVTKLGHFYVPYPDNRKRDDDDDILAPLQNDIQQIDDNMIEMEATYKPPKIVHNHLIMDEIGSGAYARVKQCLLLGTMEPRAVKIFKIERVRKINHALDDIAFEVDLLKRLKHKNIILMHDYFWNESKGKLYVFLELCHASIQQLLDFHCGAEHRLSLDAAHFYFAQLLRAVEYLHSQHIVHKDIKPGNMLLTLDHVVKLLDFGVSEEVDPKDPGHTCHGGRGTPKLQPPEIAAGGRSFDGFKVDVWCSGVTLYAMVLGHYPFDGSTIYNIYKEILEKPIVVGLQDLPLKDLLTKMTTKSPNDRLNVEQILGHVWVKDYLYTENPPVLHNLLDQSRLDTIEEYLNHYFHHVTEGDHLSKSRLDALIEDDQVPTTVSQDTVAAVGGSSSNTLTLTAPYVVSSGGGVKCVRTDPAELASSAAAKSRLAACSADLRPTASTSDVTTTTTTPPPTAGANSRRETPPHQHRNKFWRFMNNLKSKFRLSKKSDPKM